MFVIAIILILIKLLDTSSELDAVDGELVEPALDHTDRLRQLRLLHLRTHHHVLLLKTDVLSN